MSKLEDYVINHSSCTMPRCEYVENGIEIDCDACQEKMLEEHDSEIRMKTIEEVDKLEKTRWIPCSERLPDTNEAVNITWVNHNPESYYEHIKDKPYTATGHYHMGKWWWYSSVCKDYLDEYGKCPPDQMDEDIEVIAWMPSPEPYKGEEKE